MNEHFKKAGEQTNVMFVSIEQRLGTSTVTAFFWQSKQENMERYFLKTVIPQKIISTTSALNTEKYQKDYPQYKVFFQVP